MKFILRLLVSGIAVFLTAYILPGVHVSGFMDAVITAIVLGVLNAIIKPILFVLTLPITLITLGLFTLILNAIMILIVDAIVPGFRVDGFIWALLFSVVLSLVNGILHKVTQD